MDFAKWNVMACALAILLLAPFILPSVAESATFTVKGELRTVLESYDDPEGDPTLPFYQYIRLTMEDTSEVKQTVRVYGRFATDLADELPVESRLYIAYYERKGLWGSTDLKVGRQWVNSVAGSPMVDGVYVNHRMPGVLTAGLFGGGWVTVEDDRTTDKVWGFILGEEFIDKADLSASYLQKWDDGDLARELFGFEGSVGLPWRGRAYAEAQYDMLSQVLGYYLAGARIAPGKRWTLRGEYYGSTPVFDATDIYSVFAVDEFREASISADYRLDKKWTLFGRYAREFYRELDDANVVEAGAELRRPAALGGYLAFVLRSSGEELRGVKAAIRGPVPYGITLDAGAEVNVYNRVGDSEEDDTSARRYWLEGKRSLGEDLSLAVKVERIESLYYDYYNRGRIALRYRF